MEKLRWYEIPEEKRALIIERHKRGDNFSKIGRDMKIDRRVVARIVRKDDEMQSGQVVIRRNEQAQLFHDHLDDIKKAAVVLLELTASPAVRNSLLPFDSDVESNLLERLSDGWSPSSWLSKEPTIVGEDNLKLKQDVQMQIQIQREVEKRLARRRARAAIEGLKEHASALEKHFLEWQEATTIYKETWELSKDQAGKSGIPADRFEAVVEVALEQIPTIDDGLARKWSPPSNEVGRYVDILLRPANRRFLKLLWQELSWLNNAYENLEAILSPPLLDKTLVRGWCKYCLSP